MRIWHVGHQIAAAIDREGRQGVGGVRGAAPPGDLPTQGLQPPVRGKKGRTGRPGGQNGDARLGQKLALVAPRLPLALLALQLGAIGLANKTNIGVLQLRRHQGSRAQPTGPVVPHRAGIGGQAGCCALHSAGRLAPSQTRAIFPGKLFLVLRVVL